MNMNTTFTKSGTIPQTGLDRVRYIRMMSDLVVANPSMEIAVSCRNGQYLQTIPAALCQWNWDAFDFGTKPEPPKIQLRLPMYVKAVSGKIKTVLVLDNERQSVILAAGHPSLHVVLDLSKPINPDTTYSHDGTNWQPFTGNEVI